MILAFSFGFIAKHPGLLLVFIGVAGEVICDWKEMSGRLSWAKKLSAILLVLGLTIEFIEAAKSDKDVAETKERAAIAEREAGQANESAAKANERAANTESNNLVLRSKVLEIEAKNKWRMITSEQKDLFIELTKNISKFPIRVRMGANSGTEVQSFAKKIREMLDASGFLETNTDLALTEWPPELNILYNGGMPEMSSVIFLNNLTTTSNIIDLRDAQSSLHSFGNYSPTSTVKTVLYMINNDSEQKAFITSDHGEPVLNIPIPSSGAFKMAAFMGIQNAFNNMGITTEWMTITNIPEGVCEVFINPK
jgi:hypothetical protein